MPVEIFTTAARAKIREVEITHQERYKNYPTWPGGHECMFCEENAATRVTNTGIFLHILEFRVSTQWVWALLKVWVYGYIISRNKITV